MLVFISDLHLTDGSTSDSLAPGVAELFAERLNDLAERASWRADGKYRPIERMDLVLLGDTIDLFRSAEWRRTDARPWIDPYSEPTIDAVQRIVNGVLSHNSELLQYLRTIAAHGGIALAPGSVSGQPVYNAELLAVPVHLHYMVGEHDWMLRLSGRAYDALRRQVSQHFGLSPESRTAFAHEPAESAGLYETLRRHRVFARHGEIFDPLSFHDDRNESSVSDVLVIELLGRFLHDVSAALGDDLPNGLIELLRDLDHVHPITAAPMWMAGLLERACSSAALRREVKRMWDDRVDRVLQLEAIRERDSWSPLALIDGLRESLMFSRRANGSSSQPPSAVGSERFADLAGLGGSYARHALLEQEFRNRRAKHIVYGHTHRAETIPLDASSADGFTLHQTYFNAGTWRRVYQPTHWEPARNEYLPSETMTYLAFFQGDERGGRAFETWSGTLASVLSTVPHHRLDARRNENARSESVSPSGLSIGAPHFTGAPAAARTPAADRF